MYKGFFNLFAQNVSKFVWSINKLISSLNIKDLALRECKNINYFNIIVGRSLLKQSLLVCGWGVAVAGSTYRKGLIQYLPGQKRSINSILIIRILIRMHLSAEQSALDNMAKFTDTHHTHSSTQFIFALNYHSKTGCRLKNLKIMWVKVQLNST